MRFSAEELAALAARKRSYELMFGKAFAAGTETDAAKDLMRFCRANESCFHIDPRAHAALEGRREVYLRIRQHLDLTVEQLAELYGAVAPTKDTDA